MQILTLKNLIEQEPAINDARLVTTDERFLGNLTDLYFHESGSLAGHEISGVIFADVLSGRSFVPASYVLQVEQREIIVAPDVAASIEQQAGGVKVAVQSTKERLPNTPHPTRMPAKEGNR